MIKFGTSGWRGIIGEDFTFKNVRLVTKALANIITNNKRGKNGILVGYDTRFLSERFAKETANILAAEGIKTYLTLRDTPTPAISYEIIKSKLEGGINFTASNNSAEYNGLKFFSNNGCTALPEQTDLLEQEIDKIEMEGTVISAPPLVASVESIDIKDSYIEFLKEKINFEPLINSGLQVGLDLLYGTARDYLDELLYSSGCKIHPLHNFRDPYFGGYSPQSTEENLVELKELIKEKKLDIGLATNADSDRFGVLDEKGNYIHPNVIIPCLLNYLAVDRKFTGAVARSVATSHIIDHVAKKHGLDVIETPVGFKYISSLLVTNKICFGGEESGGMTKINHIPVKDGILACMLVVEMLARTGEPLSRLIRKMFEDIGGEIFFTAESFNIDDEGLAFTRKRLKNIPSKIADIRVVNISQTDGVKLYLEDDSWVLIRFSGTEPKIRLYAESSDRKSLSRIMKAAKEHYIL
ncbi:MAG: phosphoglucomutase/phosphomannomutase family protein [Acidobacteria bacterium]|nr:phosphoglucomutase/phosphomannomutase family protein [Acidobacteriota bacterium]